MFYSRYDELKFKKSIAMTYLMTHTRMLYAYEYLSHNNMIISTTLIIFAWGGIRVFHDGRFSIGSPNRSSGPNNGDLVVCIQSLF